MQAIERGPIPLEELIEVSLITIELTRGAKQVRC